MWPRLSTHVGTAPLFGTAFLAPLTKTDKGRAAPPGKESIGRSCQSAVLQTLALSERIAPILLRTFRTQVENRRMFSFIAETVWQAMEVSLAYIGTVLTILLVVVILIGLSAEWKLGRLRRIGLAIHDRLKEAATQRAELLKAQQEGNALLKYVADREYEKANAKRPPSVAPLDVTPPAAPEVYRID